MLTNNFSTNEVVTRSDVVGHNESEMTAVVLSKNCKFEAYNLGSRVFLHSTPLH